jgi:tetratricopeptide (TPR) repeat protein
VSRKIQAAQVLYRYGNRSDAQALLRAVWESPESATESFECFLSLMEIWISKDRTGAMLHLEELSSGYGPNSDFWESLSLSDRSVIYEWLGQVQLVEDHPEHAYESLNRAASLGRDTSLLWRLLGDLSLAQGDLEMSLRFLKRSLHLYRQLDLEILSGRNYSMGCFMGEDPLKWSHGVSDFMKVLLKVTKMAKGRKNLKAARELLMEMLHQFPDESRLPKLRLLLERSIVEHSLFASQGVRPQIEMR